MSILIKLQLHFEGTRYNSTSYKGGYGRQGSIFMRRENTKDLRPGARAQEGEVELLSERELSVFSFR